MRFLLLPVLLLISLPAQAWWQDDWNFRKELTVDTSPAGGDIAGTLTDVPVLVRLHAGNFGYFLDTQSKGEDLSFVASDDKTPLKYRIETTTRQRDGARLGATAEPGRGSANSSGCTGTPPRWRARTGGIYDADQALVYHFTAEGASPVDARPKAPSAVFTAQPVSAALIGAGAVFTGSESLEIAPTPVLSIDPQTGWTFTTWLRISQAQTPAVLFPQHTRAHPHTLPSTILPDPGRSVLTPSEWQHLRWW